ncbi:hypothetical protein ElyMa_000462000 [Elysia marginata]|uniref:Thyroglobulin type-1 domain-containing protein n=1 Tax=Elysia marginata TaxID=1093978 RepID=A0AAV4FSN1_9GAST|nr:hypothetical protein ElyMa_000462000 [Elysia marginata]
MKAIVIACIVLSVVAVALADTECVKYDDNSGLPNPCVGKRRVRDRNQENTYCCADASLRPLGHRTVRAGQPGQYDYHCRCITQDEYCEEYPLFC